MGSARVNTRDVVGGVSTWESRRTDVALATLVTALLAVACSGVGPGEAGAGEPPEGSLVSSQHEPRIHTHDSGQHQDPDPAHGHAHGHNDRGGEHGDGEAVASGGHGHHGAAHLDRNARLTIAPDEAGRQLLLSIGPVNLPAADGEAVMRITPGLEAPLGFTGWLVGLDVRLEDAHGEVLPHELLHHVNLIMPGRRDLFRPMMLRLGAAGPETDAMRLPWPLGLRVAGDEDLLVVAVLHNESTRDYGDVYVKAEVDTRRRGRVAVYPFMMDVIPPPVPASWDLPPGRSERSWEGSPAVDGRILGIGAHMHRYGQELVLEDVTAGRVLYRSQPLLDDDGEIISIPQDPLLPFGVRLRADHRYRVTAVYDNPTADTIPDGAMGVFGGVFRPSGGWPDLDRTAPLYLDDRAAIRR